jgi:hypothetical protein
VLPNETVTLPAGQRRVAQAVGLPVSPWKEDDIRWIADHWGLFRRQLQLCEEFEEDLMEMARNATPLWVRGLRHYVAGFRWWLTEATLPARACLLAVGVFAFSYGFGLGWLE